MNQYNPIIVIWIYRNRYSWKYINNSNVTQFSHVVRKTPTSNRIEILQAKLIRYAITLKVNYVLFIVHSEQT